jgi:DnaJ-class molecular chaperone
MTDFYSILGIPSSASPTEIKQAYRRLAMKWHPDRLDSSASAAARSKFQSIQEAYDTLSSPTKRRSYDATRGGRTFEFTDPFLDGVHAEDFVDIFEDLAEHNIYSQFANRGSGGSTRHRAPPQTLDVPFHILDNGGDLGTGPGQLVIPRATRHGSLLHASDGRSYFLNATFPAAAHKITPDDFDISMALDVPLETCLVGGDVQFNHWSGALLKFNIAAGTFTGGRIRLKNHGLLKSSQTQERGNLYFTVHTTFPSSLPPHTLTALRGVFKPPLHISSLVF